MRYGSGHRYGTGKYYGAGEGEATAQRRGIVEHFVIEIPVEGRRGVLEHFVLEIPDYSRRGIVEHFVIEIPAEARRGIVEHFVLEIPDYSRRGIVEHFVLEIPREVRRGILEHFVLEVPESRRRGIIEHFVLEIPDGARRGIVEHFVLEIPDYNRRGVVEHFYILIPSPPAGSGGPVADTPETPGGIDPVTGLEVVTTYDRMVECMNATAFEVQAGKQSWSHYGSGQFRPSAAAGRAWEEEYATKDTNDPLFRGFLSYLNDLYRNKRIVLTDHPDYTALGTISGAALVSGDGQVGNLLNSTGWTGTLKRGDIISVDGLKYTLEVLDDVTATVTTLIPISPAIREGMSPQGGARIFYGADVRYRVVVDEIKGIPDSDAYGVSVGLIVRLREAP